MESESSKENLFTKKNIYIYLFLWPVTIQFSAQLDAFYHAKGIVHPKMQVKLFLMISESFLTLHWQQRNYDIQGPER